MENKLNITRRTVTIASLTAIFVITSILAVLSLFMRQSPDDEIEGIELSEVIVSEIDVILTENSNNDFDMSSIDSSETFVDSIVSDMSDASPEGDGFGDSFAHGWIINEFGYTYVYNGCGYEQFNYKTTALNRYISSNNEFAKVVPDDVRIFNILVPVSSTFADIPREIYTSDSFFNQSQSAFVSTVSEYNNERIIDLSIVSQIEQQYDNGEPVFFRTDKNWTSLGAYTAYRAFCDSAELDGYSLDSFELKNVGEFLGAFYNATKLDQMSHNPDEFFCYSTLPTVKTSLTIYDNGRVYTEYKLCNNKVGANNAYDIYFGRTAGRYEVSTNVDGGALLIVGDSSSYALVPYLASHYGIIEIIDPRNVDCGLEELISKREYSDCILMCYTTNAVNGEFVPSLNKFIGVENE